MLQKPLLFILYLVLLSFPSLSYSLSPSFSWWASMLRKITIVTTIGITTTNIVELGTQTMFVTSSQVRWGSLFLLLVLVVFIFAHQVYE
jgi:hypothetical protein